MEVFMLVSEKDKAVLRELAKRYREIAEDPVMAKRKILWRDLHDLKPQRPMIIFEPYWLDGYLADYELRCENTDLRNVETKMMFTIRQYEQMNDDIVVEPYFRLGWQGVNINSTGRNFGEIKIIEDTAKDGGLAYKSQHPIHSADDVKHLSPRNFKVERGPVLAMQSALMEIFGDILPVLVGNFDNFDPLLGNQPFVGNFFIGITWDVFKLIGAEAMMLWPYDEPDALKELLDFLVEDKKRFFKYLQDERLLCSNTDNQFAGPSCYGYVSDLPAGKTDDTKLSNLWAWSDSQETQMMSPEMYAEFYLPAIAEMTKLFGLIYYGCCERVDQKMPAVLKAIPKIRNFSISGWTDVDSAAEQMGNRYVASKKPIPALVSTPTPDWDAVKEEAQRTWNAVKRNNTPLEVICRDVYSSTCTPKRAVEWVRIWKETIGI
jgi:hypothetical protein